MTNYPDIINALGDADQQFERLSGWHTGTILEEYEGQDGTVFRTEDTDYFDRDGNQVEGLRRLRLIVQFNNPTAGNGTETAFISVPYRPVDLVNDKLAVLPKSHNDISGEDTDQRRLWRTVRKLATLQKAAAADGRTFLVNGGDRLDPTVAALYGLNLDVNKTPESGFGPINTFNPFAPAGSQVKK